MVYEGKLYFRMELYTATNRKDLKVIDVMLKIYVKAADSMREK